MRLYQLGTPRLHFAVSLMVGVPGLHQSRFGTIADRSSDFVLSGVLSGAPRYVCRSFSICEAGLRRLGDGLSDYSLWNPTVRDGWMDSKGDEPDLELLPERSMVDWLGSSWAGLFVTLAYCPTQSQRSYVWYFKIMIRSISQTRVPQCSPAPKCEERRKLEQWRLGRRTEVFVPH